MCGSRLLGGLLSGDVEDLLPPSGGAGAARGFTSVPYRLGGCQLGGLCSALLRARYRSAGDQGRLGALLALAWTVGSGPVADTGPVPARPPRSAWMMSRVRPGRRPSLGRCPHTAWRPMLRNGDGPWTGVGTAPTHERLMVGESR